MFEISSVSTPSYFAGSIDSSALSRNIMNTVSITAAGPEGPHIEADSLGIHIQVEFSISRSANTRIKLPSWRRNASAVPSFIDAIPLRHIISETATTVRPSRRPSMQHLAVINKPLRRGSTASCQTIRRSAVAMINIPPRRKSAADCKPLPEIPPMFSIARLRAQTACRPWTAAGPGIHTTPAEYRHSGEYNPSPVSSFHHARDTSTSSASMLQFSDAWPVDVPQVKSCAADDFSSTSSPSDLMQSNPLPIPSAWRPVSCGVRRSIIQGADLPCRNSICSLTSRVDSHISPTSSLCASKPDPSSSSVEWRRVAYDQSRCNSLSPAVSPTTPHFKRHTRQFTCSIMTSMPSPSQAPDRAPPIPPRQSFDNESIWYIDPAELHTAIVSDDDAAGETFWDSSDEDVDDYAEEDEDHEVEDQEDEDEDGIVEFGCLNSARKCSVAASYARVVAEPLFAGRVLIRRQSAREIGLEGGIVVRA